MAIAPLRWSAYKGTGGKFGALQLNLQKPHYYCPVNPKGCRKDFDSAMPKKCSGTKDNPHEPALMESREGCLFLEITSATGPNKYDWDDKIVMNLSIHDMAQVLFVLESDSPDGQPGKEVKLMHDPGAKSETQGKVQKYLTISSPKGIRTGCLVQASMKTAGNEDLKKHMVPLSGYEVKELAVFIRAALVSSLGW